MNTSSAPRTPIDHSPPEHQNKRLQGGSYWATMLLGSIGLTMAINQAFYLHLLGFQPLGNSFLYYMIGVFLAAAYLSFPARKTRGAKKPTPWYDWTLAFTALLSSIYLGQHGLTIIEQGWEYNAPLEATVASAVLLGLVLEGVRRCGGFALLIVAVLFGSYPLYADYMPAFLWGTSFGLDETIRAHVMGVGSILGIPMQVVAQVVIGFVVFGAALTATGGGAFFMNLAISLMGQRRGGPAKVAVISSGIMGSLSGSVISNILTTGPITIPTMKRTGYPAHYAASIEACASTGGALMPPVMGAVAFIMASFLGVPYSDVMVAAFLPALLFYVVLLFQVDVYAARNDLKGMSKNEIPNFTDTLKDGWPYLLSLFLLIYFLLVMRLEAHAPYYATLALLLTSFLKKNHRLNKKKLLEFLEELTTNVASLVAILTGIGLVVGGLSYTGVAGAFSRELLQYAGGSIPLMLAAGAVTSFVLGMGMTVSSCYIFLSILLAPALVAAGLNPLASHLFILYWGMLSYITPPVSLASITAAGIAGCNALKAGLYSMRIGSILFVLPFLFVLNPSLVMQGEPLSILISAITAVIAMWLLASALEGYFYCVGVINWPVRALLLAATGALVYPGIYSDVMGFSLIALIYLGNYVLPSFLTVRKLHEH